MGTNHAVEYFTSAARTIVLHISAAVLKSRHRSPYCPSSIGPLVPRGPIELERVS